MPRTRKNPNVETMTAIVIEPEKKPRIVQAEKGLDALQRYVGGMIDVTYPFNDSVGIVCNDDGIGALNRALRYDGELRNRGEIYGIIRGKFLIVGLTEESFGDLTEEQQRRYMARFHRPECFFNIGGKLYAFEGTSRFISNL